MPKILEMFVVKDASTGKYIDCDSDGELSADDKPTGLWWTKEVAQGFIEGYQTDNDEVYWLETGGIDLKSLVVVPVEIRERP